MTKAPDLFGWPELRDAAARVNAAEIARTEAARRAMFAPYGKIQQRRAELAAATSAALAAEVAYTKLRTGQ